MKNIIILLLISIICIFSVTACTEERTVLKGIQEPDNTEGELEITCTSLTWSAIELKMVNNTDTNWGYGLEPYLQCITNGEWTDVAPVTDIDIPEIWAELPAKGGQNSQTLKLSEWYGDLPDGHYRAGVKLSGEAGEQMLWYEFEVDTIID